MTRPRITLDGGEMIARLRRKIFRVRKPAAQAVLFIHPGDDANGALRLELELANQIGRLHRNGDARRIINRARSQVPRIKMTRNDDDLFGMLAALDVSDDVITLYVRERLRRQRQS